MKAVILTHGQFATEAHVKMFIDNDITLADVLNITRDRRFGKDGFITTLSSTTKDRCEIIVSRNSVQSLYETSYFFIPAEVGLCGQFFLHIRNETPTGVEFFGKEIFLTSEQHQIVKEIQADNSLTGFNKQQEVEDFLFEIVCCENPKSLYDLVKAPVM